MKERGPFQSIAEFVNRRISSDLDMANAGALQSAIENSAINTNIGVSAPKNYDETEPGSTGSAFTGDGAATQIIQSDLLNRLAPSITVRGDTFKIRAYGEATVDNNTTRVWCEAVVQRGHKFMDTEDESTIAVGDLDKEVNKTFGRRFEIVSFRWLTEPEV